MYVCICKGITDKQIRQAAARCGGSLRAVRNELGAMTQCGKCAIETRDIVRQFQQEPAELIPESLAYSVA